MNRTRLSADRTITRHDTTQKRDLVQHIRCCAGQQQARAGGFGTAAAAASSRQQSEIASSWPTKINSLRTAAAAAGSRQQAAGSRQQAAGSRQQAAAGGPHQDELLGPVLEEDECKLALPAAASAALKGTQPEVIRAI